MILTTTLTGLTAGAMLFIELVLLDFWRAMAPSEFRAWFAQHSGRIRALMAPLGAGSAAVGIGTAAVEGVTGDGPAPSTVVAAGAAVGVVAITMAVNEPANEKLVQPEFDDAETVELLGRWARWHHIRVALGLLGTVAAGFTSAKHQ